MVGVSNPIMRADPRAGWRFIAGLGAGMALSTAVLAGPLLLLAAGAGQLPWSVRVGLAVALVAGLGLTDLRNHTPHVWRQVPQRLGRELIGRPGQLGLIWGFDLGLLVTTQKTSSLVWVGLAGAVLLGSPSTVVLALAASAALYWLAMSMLVITGDSFLAEPDWLVRRFGGWGGLTRRLAGAGLWGMGIGLVVMLP